jgi:hypothetical protein
MDEALDLAIEGRSPYPEKAAFIDADEPGAGHAIERAADQGTRSRFVPQPFPRELEKLGFRLLEPRRGAGVVERGSLENCWRRKALVGSNPTPSAC